MSGLREDGKMKQVEKYDLWEDQEVKRIKRKKKFVRKKTKIRTSNKYLNISLNLDPVRERPKSLC